MPDLLCDLDDFHIQQKVFCRQAIYLASADTGFWLGQLAPLHSLLEIAVSRDVAGRGDSFG